MEKLTLSITGKRTNTHQRSKNGKSSNNEKWVETSTNTEEKDDTSEMNKADSWYLYLIENKLGQLYTGITTDPSRRISQHRGEKPGGAKALKGKTPLIYRAVFKVGSKSEAATWECRVKKMSRAQKETVIQAGLLTVTSINTAKTLKCIAAKFID